VIFDQYDLDPCMVLNNLSGTYCKVEVKIDLEVVDSNIYYEGNAGVGSQVRVMNRGEVPISPPNKPCTSTR
jgi:hypothetical protein